MPRKKSIVAQESTVSEKSLSGAAPQNSLLIEKKHQQIVDGACGVFFRKGYHPTTTRDIAKACDMSIGQLYHYITSKDDVLFLVHQHTQKIWHDYLKKADSAPMDDPLQRFKESLHHSLDFMIENRKLIQFIYSESKYLDRKNLKTVLDLDYDNVVCFWRDLLVAVHKKYPIQGDINFVSSLIAFLVAFLALRGWTLKEKPNQNHAAALVEFILGGLGLSGPMP